MSSSLAEVRSGKISGLFKWIKAEQHNLRSKEYEIDSSRNSERSAFFIKVREVTGEEAVLNLRGYQRVEGSSHLTIDEFYRGEGSEIGIRGYLYAHATYQYRHASGETITIHVFFNKTGNLIPPHLRPIRARIQGSDRDLELTPEEETQLKENTKEASATLFDLLRYKSENYEKIRDETSRLEIELAQLETEFLKGSSNPEQERVKKNYIEVAEKFIELIRHLNLYSDSSYDDARGEVIQRRVKILKGVGISIPADIVPADKKEMEEEALVEGEAIIAQPVASKRSSPSKINLLPSIEAQEKEFDGLMAISGRNTRQQIKVLEKARDLRESILVLSLEKNLTSKQETRRQKLISRIEEKIKKVPSILSLVEEVYKKGDLESFKLLFSFDRYSTTCYQTLKNIIFLLVVCEKKNSSLGEGRIAICEYLFEHSENYRNFLSFSLNSLGGSKGGSLTLTIQDNYGVFISPLIMAAAERNFPVCRMLLEHGYSVRGYGLQHEGYLLSMLRAYIVYSGNDEEAVYLKLLLEKGISVNKPCIKTITSSNSVVSLKGFEQEIKVEKEVLVSDGDVKFAKDALPVKQNLSLEQKRNLDTVLRCALDKSTDLVFACRIQRYAIVPMLQTASARHSLYDLALAIGSLTGLPDSVEYRMGGFKMQSYFNRGNYGLFFSYPDVIQIGQKISDPNHPRQMQIIITPATDDLPHYMITAVRGVYDAFIEKCQSSTRLKISKAVEKFTLLLQQCMSSRDRIFGDYCYRAALFLMIQERSLSKEDVIKIMQLEQSMVALYLAGETPDKDNAMRHCENILRAVKFLGYIEDLQQHAWFRLAYRRLVKLSGQKVTSVPVWGLGSSAAASSSHSNPQILSFAYPSFSAFAAGSRISSSSVSELGARTRDSAVDIKNRREIASAAVSVLSPDLLQGLAKAKSKKKKQ